MSWLVGWLVGTESTMTRGRTKTIQRRAVHRVRDLEGFWAQTKVPHGSSVCTAPDPKEKQNEYESEESRFFGCETPQKIFHSP